MKAKVVYSVLCHGERKNRKITQEYEVPDFKEIKHPPFIHKGVQVIEETVTTVGRQIESWLEDIDKRAFMDEHDIAIIYDWEVRSYQVETGEIVRSNKNKGKLSTEEMLQLFCELHLKEVGLQKDFEATYSVLKSTIKNLSFKKQCDIIMKTMSVGYMASTTVLDDLKKYQASLERKVKDGTFDRYLKNKYGSKLLENGK